MGVPTRLVAGTEITGNSRVIDSLNPLWLPKTKKFQASIEARSDYSSIFPLDQIPYFGWLMGKDGTGTWKIYFQ